MLPLCVEWIDFNQAPPYGETLFVNRQIANTLGGAACNTSQMGLALRRFGRSVGAKHHSPYISETPYSMAPTSKSAWLHGHFLTKSGIRRPTGLWRFVPAAAPCMQNKSKNQQRNSND